MIFGLAAAVAAQAAEPAKDWRAIARADVLGAYEQFAANHPGMKNPADPGFVGRLRAARDGALELADISKDESGYRGALDAFTAGLSDGHALVYAKKGGGDGAQWLWPGFVAAWRGDRAVIHHAGPDSPAPPGSAIVSCDGMAVAAAIPKFLRNPTFRPGEAGQWWEATPSAFASASGWERPNRCTFSLPDGTVREAVLPWSRVINPVEMIALLQRAARGERTPIGLSEPRPGMFLVGLPEFNPGAAGIEAYRSLYAELARRRPDLLRAKAIMLDLRSNNGGSSEWSREVAHRLWGKAAAEARIRDYYRRVRIWWRVSPDNVAHMAEMEAKARGNEHGDMTNRLRGVADGMKRALAAGRDFHVERAGEKLRGGPPPTDLRTPVYVITHGACVSACLDAVDTFKRFANVKLIGAPTSADSTYMEVRSTDLPSGLGRIVIPLKIWMHRPRASGEVYRPDIEMAGIDWSTAAFLDRIETDLARR